MLHILCKNATHCYTKCYTQLYTRQLSWVEDIFNVQKQKLSLLNVEDAVNSFENGSSRNLMLYV